jgi:hypothetical protein
MGSLLHGDSGTEIGFDDRSLMHLQVVITAKLRRRESFLFTWINAAEGGGGRSSILFAQGNAIVYRFAGSRAPSLNRDWIETLMLSANSAAGLQFSSEPIAVRTASPGPGGTQPRR